MKHRLRVNLQAPWALTGHSGLPEEKNQGFFRVCTSFNPSSSIVPYYFPELYSTQVSRR